MKTAQISIYCNITEAAVYAARSTGSMFNKTTNWYILYANKTTDSKSTRQAHRNARWKKNPARVPKAFLPPSVNCYNKHRLSVFFSWCCWFCFPLERACGRKLSPQSPRGHVTHLRCSGSDINIWFLSFIDPCLFVTCACECIES